MPGPIILYVINYSVYFPVAADGIAARVANGGSTDLGKMTPAAAALAYPTASIGVLAPWEGFGGVVTGSGYASFYNGGSHVGTTYTPTDQILMTTPYTTATMTVYTGFSTPAVYTVAAEWCGTLTWDAAPPPPPGTLPPPEGPPQPIAGKFLTQIIKYTGDGIDGRVLPTTFPLDTADSRVVAFVFPRGAGQTPIFRTNDSGMIGTAAVGSSTLDTLGGSGTGPIDSFTAAGLVVNKTAATTTRSANALNIKYVALIFCDTTASPSRYIEVGHYVGRGADSSKIGSFTNGSPIVGGIFTLASDVGRSFTTPVSSGAGGTYTNEGFIDAAHFRIGSSWSGSTGSFTCTVPGGGQITTLPFVPTVVWDFMGSTIFRSDDFSGDSSVFLSTAVNVPAGQITSLNGTHDETAIGAESGSFSIGDASTSVNFTGRTYFWAAFHIPAGNVARRLFTTYKAIGTASAVDQVTGLELTPTFATARDISGAISEWRGAWHTGVESESFAGGTEATQGIRAFGDGTIDLGTTVAPNGMDIYGWAMVGGQVVVYTPPPNPPPTPPEGPTPPPPLACTPVILPSTGCTAPAGAATSGVAGCAAAAPVFCQQ
jgi:hypothetical protein